MNKRFLNEAAISWLKELRSGADEYSTIGIVGTYSKNIKFPVIISGIGKEIPILNESNGLLNINLVTMEKTILYKSDFPVELGVYAKIDDEASRIAEIFVDKIREHSHNISSEKIKIERVFDDIYVGTPLPRELSEEKVFRVLLRLMVRCYEVKVKKS